MTQEFKPGDVVRMKSGSPEMTILRVDGAVDPTTEKEWTKITTCYWDHNNNEPRESYFPSSMLALCGGVS